MRATARVARWYGGTKARYYRRRNITQKIAGVTPSSLVNYRELPIIIRTVKVFTIVVGQAARGRDAESQWGPPCLRIRRGVSFWFSPPAVLKTRVHLSPKRRSETHLMRYFANKSFPPS